MPARLHPLLGLCNPPRADDADWAFKKMDGFRFDGREWRVEWANHKDFEVRCSVCFYGCRMCFPPAIRLSNIFLPAIELDTASRSPCWCLL